MILFILLQHGRLQHSISSLVLLFAGRLHLQAPQPPQLQRGNVSAARLNGAGQAIQAQRLALLLCLLLRMSKVQGDGWQAIVKNSGKGLL